jgi:hypothetical protein
MPAKVDNSKQPSAATAEKEENATVDDGHLSGSPPSSINPIDELTVLRTTIAPLIGRMNSAAIAQLSEAIDNYPDQTQWYLSRGIVNAKLEKFDQAIQDLSTAIELEKDTTTTSSIIPESGTDTVCTAILHRARARADLGDLVGAVNDAKLALEEQASSGLSSTLQTECRNASALYQQKLQKQKEIEASGPEIVHHGAGVVIEDVTEEHAKVSAKKAGVIAAVRIAKGIQQADVGKEFRAQFNEKVRAYEEEVRERSKKEKKKNKKKKKKQNAAAVEAVAAVAAAEEVESVSPVEKKEESNEEFKKLYKVETFPDPEDATITIERIHIPITFVEENKKKNNNGSSSDKTAVSTETQPTNKNDVEKSNDDTDSSTSIATLNGAKMEGIIPGMSIGTLNESTFDFLQRYNF